jgi:heme oxygenase (biliverdin-IX-beta and delta-forming)
MPVEKAPSDPISTRAEQVLDARRLMRTAVKGSLATLDHETGHPYASLVLVATEPDGAPVFLLSLLARHGKNLCKDARASLLVDGTGDSAEPLTGNRLTLSGEVVASSSATARRRFLARYPSASGYVDFGDFSFHTFKIASGHFIGGFGRIFAIEAPALSADINGANALIEAEPDILEHMNSDHADAIALYATELAGRPAGDWRMCGIDPEGADLLHRTNAARIDFPKRVSTPGEARATLVELVQQARAQQGAKR